MTYNNAYFVIQTIQAPDQTIDREFTNAAGDKGGNVRLLDPEDGSSLGLSQLPAFDDPANFTNKLGFEKVFFRIGKTQIGKTLPMLKVTFFALLMA